MSINGRRQKRRNNTNREGWNIGTFKEPAVLKRKGGIIPLGGMEHYRRLMKYVEGGRGWVNKLLNLKSPSSYKRKIRLIRARVRPCPEIRKNFLARAKSKANQFERLILADR